MKLYPIQNQENVMSIWCGAIDHLWYNIVDPALRSIGISFPDRKAFWETGVLDFYGARKRVLRKSGQVTHLESTRKDSSDHLRQGLQFSHFLFQKESCGKEILQIFLASSL